MCSKCGRWMEGKKRVVPREVCAERSEKSNRYCEITLNAQKSAKERLINWGFYDLATAYQSLHVNY